MVFDRSKSFDSRSCGEKYAQNSSASRSETGLSEKIIYIIDANSQSMINSRSLVDLTTHLDDDEFNDYEIKSSNSSLCKKEAVRYIQNANEINHLKTENENFEYSSVKNDIDETVSNLVDEILEHEDTFTIQHSQSSRNSNEANNLNYYGSGSDSIRIDNLSVEGRNVQFLSTSSLSETASLVSDTVSTRATLEYEFDPYKTEEIESYKKHMNKRKQTYNVKEDGFSELLDDGKNAQQDCVPINKSKKKKLAYNKENQRERLQSQKRNPFANVKMSSILKRKKTTKKTKSSSKDQAVEPMTPNYDENFASISSCSYGDEVMIHRKSSCQYNDFYSSNSKDDVSQDLGKVTHLNSDLSNADYLDYVQPREQIVESDMDKLLSPTIENDPSERIKTQQSINESKRLVDCNGNEVDFQDIQKISTLKSVLSPSQIAERELFLYSAHAKKLGMENLFNTSNDAVINEIIFNTNVVCEQINLELNLMRGIEGTHLQKTLEKNSFFQAVSCTLVESLNELHRFGGFIDENSQETKSSREVTSSAVPINNEFVNISGTNNFQKYETHISSSQLNEKEKKQLNSNLRFNFSNKSNLLGIDFQSRYDTLEHIPNVNHDVKRSPAPLIIKMKRINQGNNEYVIDDSSRQTMKASQKKTAATVNNIERYECHDCSEKFRTKRILKNHVSEYHKGPYDVECEICFMKFKKSSAHKKHLPWCPKSIVHKCNICDRIYCYRASLEKHLKTHQR
ncbi:hypothetical protein TSAR_016065 [Trichomalopsis sarcophagae]|uniref:C2H2-type domain-containing protein n=1 Tax=Trichomalopsis sarcophagae TaxID=543379 RepID=A0A232FBY5_9HYME|nr:hypothetical protein TSAR_016065 [Trichomalopsis sarcophagae]